jgi:sodium/potassium-transporting ATPase subunit alpha
MSSSDLGRQSNLNASHYEEIKQTIWMLNAREEMRRDFPSQVEHFSKSPIFRIKTKIKPKKLEKAKKSKKAKLSKKERVSTLKDAEEFRTMDDHRIPIDDLRFRLDLPSLETGLTSQTALKRYQEEGPNLLTEKKGTPWYIRFLKQITNFFAILMWIAAGLAIFVYFLDPSDFTNMGLGIVLIAVILITGYFSYYQESKSIAIMSGFKKLQPQEATVLRDGKTINIEASKLVRGDIVKIMAGNNIPADIRLTEVNHMKVDNSSLTGESEKLERTVECTHPDNALETKNLVFFGTSCEFGTGTGVVIRVGDNTVIGKIADLASTEEVQQTTLARELYRFTALIAVVSVVIGVTMFVLGYVTGLSIERNLIFAVGIIVANIPEALLATVTVALTLTAKRMATRNVLVKNLEAIETLGATTCICSDKTGTLTENRMTVTNLWLDNTNYDVLLKQGTMSDPDINYFQEQSQQFRTLYKDLIQKPTFKMLHKCAVLNNKTLFDFSPPADQLLTHEYSKELSHQEIDELNRQTKHAYEESTRNKFTSEWNTIGDASETGLIKFFQLIEDINNTRERQPILKYDNTNVEIPFNSAHKFALTVHEVIEDDPIRGGYLALLKGAPERVWERCNSILIDGSVRPMHEFKQHIHEMNKRFGQDGRRVLGFAYSYISPDEAPKHWSPKFTSTEKPNFRINNYTFIGLVALQDPPRVGVKEAVLKCKRAGIKVIMVTGDQPITAASIARQVQIFSHKSSVDYQEEGLDIEEAERVADAVVIHGDRLQQAIASLGNPENDEESEENEIPPQLEYWIQKPEVVFARTSPAQKLIIVKACQALNHIVAVTGDGVNDSPAIKKANIGIAMGIVGSDVAKNSADILLLDDNFASILNGVEEGRLIFDNLKKSIAFTLISKMPEIMPLLAFIIFQIPLPISVVLILCIDLGTDIVPAIALAYEDKELDIMLRKPRNVQVDHLVNAKLLSFAYLQIGVMQILGGFLCYFTVMNDYGFKPSTLVGITQETGTRPSEDDVYNPESRYKGNSHIGIDEYEDEEVNWATPSDAEYDLRIWFYHFDDDDWSECEYPNDVSNITGDHLCYSTEALRHAQTSFYIAVIFLQIAALIICKTTRLSILHQGMRNNVLNASILSMLGVALIITYVPIFNVAFRTRPLRLIHFGMPAIPFFVMIFIYDEVRKWLIRRQRMKLGDKPGPVEKFTYY